MRWAGRFAAALSAALAVPLFAQDVAPNIIGASYADPTERYDHGILGDAIEWGALVFNLDMCPACAVSKRGTARLVLPENRVFEDFAPRLVDLDASPFGEVIDGGAFNEVIVVETDLNLGARLAVYDMGGLVTATPFIGRPHRWLAPIGAADFDKDGRVEIAYVDKPHLARELKVWRYENRKLTFVTSVTGLTNHSIGEDYISGGVRDCGDGPEMVTANANWSRIIASTLSGGKLTSRDIGPHKGPASFKTAMACK